MSLEAIPAVSDFSYVEKLFWVILVGNHHHVLYCVIRIRQTRRAPYGTLKLSDSSTRLYEMHTFLYIIGAVYYIVRICYYIMHVLHYMMRQCHYIMHVLHYMMR